jgi:hypothetical protein
LFSSAATLALESQQMWRAYQRAGGHHVGSGDAQMLFACDWLSSAAIRLGTIIMPNVPAGLGPHRPQIPDPAA